MSWLSYHKESERHASDAALAVRDGAHELAVSLYAKAANAESQALQAVDKSKVRTFGITAVSAAALWFKAKEYSKAEQIAYAMLADENLPEFARENIRNLVQAIWTEYSMKRAGVEFIPGQVLVSVKGGEVVTGGAPLDLIVDKVQTIQSMFYRTIEFVRGSAHRKKGPPAKDLQESCRPWLFQSAPGSYQFSVAIQKPMQMDFFKDDVEPEKIAKLFLDVVGASSSANGETLEKIVPDENYRTTFLKLARNLSPTGKGYDRIEMRSAILDSHVGLTVDSRTNINRKIKSLTSKDGEDEQSVEKISGVLRALDLEKDWLEVVTNGKTVRVNGLQDAVDDVIGPMVNRHVCVTVRKISSKKSSFIDIEIVEE